MNRSEDLVAIGLANAAILDEDTVKKFVRSGLKMTAVLRLL